MRLRVGYGPWGPDWTTYLLMAAPWWFMPLAAPIEAVATWLDDHRFPTLHDRVWPLRGWLYERAAGWRRRRHCDDLWWEYHAA